jgi:hypothetical protein
MAGMPDTDGKGHSHISVAAASSPSGWLPIENTTGVEARFGRTVTVFFLALRD